MRKIVELDNVAFSANKLQKQNSMPIPSGDVSRFHPQMPKNVNKKFVQTK